MSFVDGLLTASHWLAHRDTFSYIENRFSACVQRSWLRAPESGKARKAKKCRREIHEFRSYVSFGPRDLDLSEHIVIHLVVQKYMNFAATFHSV